MTAGEQPAGGFADRSGFTTPDLFFFIFLVSGFPKISNPNSRHLTHHVWFFLLVLPYNAVDPPLNNPFFPFLSCFFFSFRSPLD